METLGDFREKVSGKNTLSHVLDGFNIWLRFLTRWKHKQREAKHWLEPMRVFNPEPTQRKARNRFKRGHPLTALNSFHNRL